MEYGTLYLCPTPIGNLEDITYRTLRILGEVDLVAAEDTRRSLQLLNHFGIKKPLISYFEHNKRQRGEEITSRLMEGQNVALVTDAGTPAISDPGEDLVRLCIEKQIPVVPLPGANAFVTALIASGHDTGRFTFQGFLSMNKKNRREHLLSIAKYPETLLFYEAPHKLRTTLSNLLEYLGDRNITLCRELTKTHEEFIHTTISAAMAYYETTAPKGEYVLVVDGCSDQIDEGETSDLPLEEVYAAYLKDGVDSKTALKLAAQDKGISKRRAYELLKT